MGVSARGELKICRGHVEQRAGSVLTSSLKLGLSTFVLEFAHKSNKSSKTRSLKPGEQVEVAECPGLPLAIDACTAAGKPRPQG